MRQKIVIGLLSLFLTSCACQKVAEKNPPAAGRAVASLLTSSTGKNLLFTPQEIFGKRITQAYSPIGLALRRFDIDYETILLSDGGKVQCPAFGGTYFKQPIGKFQFSFTNDQGAKVLIEEEFKKTPGKDPGGADRLTITVEDTTGKSKTQGFAHQGPVVYASVEGMWKRISFGKQEELVDLALTQGILTDLVPALLESCQ